MPSRTRGGTYSRPPGSCQPEPHEQTERRSDSLPFTFRCFAECVPTLADELADVDECPALWADFLPRFRVCVADHLLFERLRRRFDSLHALHICLLHGALRMDACRRIADFSADRAMASKRGRIQRLWLSTHRRLRTSDSIAPRELPGLRRQKKGEKSQRRNSPLGRYFCDDPGTISDCRKIQCTALPLKWPGTKPRTNFPLPNCTGCLPLIGLRADDTGDQFL